MIAPVSIPCPGAPIAAAAFASLPVLRTKQLLLRAPKIEDFALFAELCGSERARFMGGPMSIEKAWADFTNYTAGWLLRGDGMFTIAGHGRVLGFVFAGVEIGDAEIELGYIVAEDVEGQGIAFEACAAALDHLWSVGAPGVVSYIAPENTRSIALAQRLGAREDGVLEGSLIFRHRPETAPEQEARA